MGANTTTLAVIQIYFKNFACFVYTAFRAIYPAQHALDARFSVKLWSQCPET
jgi:hypothetical protein